MINMSRASSVTCNMLLKCALLLAFHVYSGNCSPQAAAERLQTKLFYGKSYGEQAGDSEDNTDTFAKLSQQNLNSAPRLQNFYQPEVHEGLPVIAPCQTVQCHMSIVVIMDSSSSVGYQDYQKELSFVKTLLEILAVKAHDAKVEVCTGVISYSSTVRSESDPCCGNSICSIVNQFKAGTFTYESGSTNTHGALKVALQMLQAARSYNKVVLLITDGRSNTGGSPIAFAKKMREEDEIVIVALGVTDGVNEAELKGISGDDNVPKIDGFDDFHKLATLLFEANGVSSESELATSFDAVCPAEESAAFQPTCSRDDEDDTEVCNWGAWSDCVNNMSKGGVGCLQSRIKKCEFNGASVDQLQEDRECVCLPVPAEPLKYFAQIMY